MSTVLDGFWLALGLLTTIPAPLVPYRPEGLGRASRWFPVVGLLLGVLLAGVYWLVGRWFSPLITGALVTAVWAALTGGLHLDGLADCCDGLLASVPRQRRLEIMRDPHVGAFGVIGLILVLLLKVAALSSLSAPLPALLIAPMWARALIVLAARQPAARPGGMGDALRSGLTPALLAQSLIVPLVATLIAGWVAWLTWPAVAASWLVCLGVVSLAHARIGGVTGDVFGAVVELSEIAILLVFAMQP